MSALAQMQAEKRDGPLPSWIRAWSDALPFATGSFDATLCKGSIDHFDRPRLSISEMARVTRLEGTVVLAIANFESSACRLARAGDYVKEAWLGRELPTGRRHYDVPHDHFTRYEIDLMREQASESIELDSQVQVVGPAVPFDRAKPLNKGRACGGQLLQLGNEDGMFRGAWWEQRGSVNVGVSVMFDCVCGLV